MRAIRTGDTHVKHLLRVIDDHAGNGSVCWLSLKTIAAEMELSERTAKRAIAKAQELEFLIVKRKTRRRACNLYMLRRAEMREAVGVIFGESESSDSDYQQDESRGQLGPSTEEVQGPDWPLDIAPERPTSPSREANLAPRITEAALEAANSIKPTPPTPNSNSDEANWELVVVELLKFGVQETDKPVTSARSRGCSAAYVMELIAHARSKPGAWDAAKLRRRIINAFPAQPVSEGWMPVSEAYRSKAASQTVSAGLADSQRQAALEREQREREREAAARRNDAFGALLDDLSPDELSELAEATFGRGTPAWATFNRVGATGAFRDPLLKMLERRELCSVEENSR